MAYTFCYNKNTIDYSCSTVIRLHVSRYGHHAAFWSFSFEKIVIFARLLCCNLILYLHALKCTYPGRCVWRQVCMYACGYVCMYVCVHVGMYVGMYVCMYVCRQLCMNACVYVCRQEFRYVCMHVGRYVGRSNWLFIPGTVSKSRCV